MTTEHDEVRKIITRFGFVISDNRKCAGSVDQLAALIADVRRQSMEEAAVLCESLTEVIVATHPARIAFDPNSMTARRCAAAIRARLEEGK
jgi:hypothetical protein